MMMGRYLTTVLTASAVIGLTPLPAASQTTDTSIAPRTSWGDPDLQGIWSYATVTPLQRPAEFETRKFFTAEEVAHERRFALSAASLTAERARHVETAIRKCHAPASLRQMFPSAGR